jgi:soluble epoxide hydrolase / lipid-phosphate phosphatase
MSKLSKKTIQTKRSMTYTYYVGEGDPSKPALFFIHGFPDSAHMWSDVVDKLSDLPYRVVVPDCLGYAGTSKPSDPAEYKFSGQTADLVDILNAEEVKSVVIIGHDWGCALTARFYNRYPEMCAGVMLCNVAYRPPADEPFNLDQFNGFTDKVIGYPVFQYWYLFTAPEGYKTLNANLERFWEVLHGNEDEWMRKMFCVPDAMTNYMAADKRVELKSYAKEPKWKDDFMQRLGKDGFQGPTNWYKAHASNIQFEDEKDIPKENYVVKVPFFFLGCTGDAVCLTKLIDGPKEAGLLPDFDMTEIESGHWCAMEKPDEVAGAVRAFVTKRFP